MLAMAQQAMIVAAQASELVQAEIADIQGRWAFIQAQTTQGQAAAPPRQAPVAESSR